MLYVAFHTNSIRALRTKLSNVLCITTALVELQICMRTPAYYLHMNVQTQHVAAIKFRSALPDT